MAQVVELDGATLVNADSLEYIKTLPDNHIDLIATDPPYYKVKKCGWDRQWQQADQYLQWMDTVFTEFRRVLISKNRVCLIDVGPGVPHKKERE